MPQLVFCGKNRKLSIPFSLNICILYFLCHVFSPINLHCSQTSIAISLVLNSSVLQFSFSLSRTSLFILLSLSLFSFSMLSAVGNSLDAQPNRILLVTVHHMLYPITADVLHQVFSPHGFVEKIVTFQKSAGQILSDFFLSLSFPIKIFFLSQGPSRGELRIYLVHVIIYFEIYKSFFFQINRKMSYLILTKLCFQLFMEEDYLYI